VRVDVAPLRQGLLELHAQLVHVDVHGPVAVTQGRPPDEREELFAPDDPARAGRERDEQIELADGERDDAIAGLHEPRGALDAQVSHHQVRCHVQDVEAADRRSGYPGVNGV
jgi:hypothetical protein